MSDKHKREKELEAYMFAAAAHAGQVRKYTGEDYIYHPIAVAEMVEKVPHTSEMLQAALLHDVVEDTEVTLEQVKIAFGDTVAEYVYYLSDISVPSDGKRQDRKLKDAYHYASGPAEAQTIKVADTIHNTMSIYSHDPKFWEVYKHEKWTALQLLTDADPQLWCEAKSVILERW